MQRRRLLISLCFSCFFSFILLRIPNQICTHVLYTIAVDFPEDTIHSQSPKHKTDTEQIYENMVGDIARSFGIPYRYDVRMRILGTTEQMTATLAVNELRLPISVEEFTVRFGDLGRQRLGNVDLLKGLSSNVGKPTKVHQQHM